MKKMFVDPSIEIYKITCDDVITASAGLTEESASDGNYGGTIDFDDFGL